MIARIALIFSFFYNNLRYSYSFSTTRLLKQSKLSQGNIKFLMEPKYSAIKELDDSIMNTTYHQVADKIRSISKDGLVWIAIAGPPGSGKSTFASKLVHILENSIAVPMDGFHYYKQELDLFENPAEAHARRGAYWTFNADKFIQSIKTCISIGSGTFPSFDHKIGDPIENDIIVNNTHKYVIVEGNYLLLDINPWCNLRELFDMTVFINCDIEELRCRIIKRHIGVGMTEEVAMQRVDSNDILNARLVLECQENADMLVDSLSAC